MGGHINVDAAGVYIGSDTRLYRSAVNTLRTPDSLTVDGTLLVNGNDVIAYANAQHANITDAVASHSLSSISLIDEGQDAADNLEVELALDALGLKINAILDVLDEYNMTA